MQNKKSFWGVQMALISLVYIFAAFKALSGDFSHPTVLISALLLAAHALEIPVAFYALKGRSASVPRVLLLCLLFGLVWWVPARRGVFAVN
ncbi:hypothetical protein [Stenotrophobium rhamnosiphilum]|uniref:DUF1145 domain-containing protein n=1 Tax=Stenotrophobium rhamnosiphilum TaxID=2029166 RepID=A0A2T5MBG3_9GAMM|nr:hypothetical protein [Stenotrophobium rhamnosiphilum]PTU29072.1 hypothetical protein CJD38_17075 [Stenotrophobium rhamnosiphilum]